MDYGAINAEPPGHLRLRQTMLRLLLGIGILERLQSPIGVPTYEAPFWITDGPKGHLCIPCL
jgi:hypothetical protein